MDNKFAERLNYAMNIRNMKPVQLSELTGITKSKISSYMSGRFKAKQDGVYLIAKALNISEAWLMGFDVPMERVVPQIPVEEILQIPVYGKISAGQPLEMVENIIDYTYITATEAKKGSFFALEVNGDSMDRIIPNGSRVVVRKQEELENGEIGVIVVNGYDATIKRYERDENMVFLYPESNNPEHRVQKYNLKETPISILGKVESYNKKL